ncbi:lipoprotein-releasing ABC transporter permease subunit LolE [Pantoea sp. Nvir]|uniref:lipoprotein-releasing ABC transporter permease subunit LolE n=1 Tax=Pantoea sp. Nvir TaxID=2576760 RepID=UPI0027EA233B|nr:lipoprotein-releasing ABC transporter permease subunit LolE [Pantoea sp. Nvir]CAJ0991605.1 Lipoprotein-releasing system transmembrane protein LolE [Pantoea sp. Nvir]
MVLSLSLFLGMRFSRGCQRSSMVSLVSIISTLGIAMGVAVLIIGLSSMNGFEQELNRRIIAVVPHGEIEAVNQPFRHWQSLIVSVEQVPGIAAAAPYINFNGLIEKGTKLQALQVKGVDPIQEPYLSTLPCFVEGNAWANFTAGKQQIILGSGIARSLNVKQDGWVSIMIPNNNVSTKLLQPKRILLHVSGILQLSGILDHSLALVPLADAQKYLDINDSVTGIALKMYDPFQAEKLTRNAGEATHAPVYIHSWISKFGYMYRDIQMIRSIMYLAMLLVISIACFNIISTLVMAVKDKSSDIAVLRTLGAKDDLIRAIFIWYSLLVCLFGCFIGAVVGVLISLNLTMLVYWIESLTGYHLLASNIYFINFLPSELHWLDVFSVLLVTIVLSLLAGWYPAQRASRIDPACILNHH